MKNLVIETPGRLGNFIKRIYNALKIGIFYKYNIILPKHELFNTTYIVINENINKDFEKIKDKNCFMDHYSIKNIDLSLFQQNNENTIKILKDIFIIKPNNIIMENDLLIHIRSGDLFDPIIQEHYICPPLLYYVNIIKENNFDKIYLICEDRKNPCIDKLLDIYPNIIFKIQSLEEDIKLILDSQNIIAGYGTFIPSLVMLSDKCTNIYFPSYVPNWTYRYIPKDIKLNFIELAEYYKKIGSLWENTKEQNEIMINYNY